MKTYRLLLLLLCLATSGNLSAQCVAHAGADTSICTGASFQLGDIPAGTGGTFTTYSWAPAAGLSCTNCPNPVANPTVTTTYTLTITGTTTPGNVACNVTDAVVVTVKPVPTSVFTFSPVGPCANIPIAFNNTSTGPGVLSYTWSFGNPGSGSNNSSSLQNPSHEFIAIGSTTQNSAVTLVVTSSNGCSASSTQTVTVSSLPGADLVDPLSGFKNCDGSTFTMTVYDNSSIPGTNYQIIWGDGGTDFNSPTFPGGGETHTYVTNEAFPLEYIVTGPNGCTDTARYNVANITNPAIGAANPGGTTGCAPLDLCFPLNNFEANHSSTYYVVDYGDGSPLDTLAHPPPASVCHTYTTSSCGLPGNQYIFSITAYNSCDVSEATISPIRVYIGPQAEFNGAPNPGCVNTAIGFSNSSQTGFNSSCSASTIYNWNFGDGQTLTTVSGTNPTHVYTAAGNYTVVLSTSNSCGATTDTTIICIEEPPTPDFSITPGAACVPFTAVTNNTSILGATCNVSYAWSVIFNGSPCLPSSGSYVFAGGTTATSPAPSIQFLEPGDYIVRLTITNSCGSFTHDEPITAQGPPQLTVNPLTPICAGTGTSPTATVNDCSEPVDTYAWAFAGGSPATSSDPVPPSVTYAVGGSYNVNLTVTNACGSTSASAPITVNPNAPAMGPLVNSPLCAGQTASFTSNTVAGATYSWTGPGGFTSNQQNFDITNVAVANAGTYTVTGSLNGCPGPASSVTLSIVAPPVISVTPASPSICAGSSVALTASGATTYTWSPVTDLNPTSGANVTANPAVTTTYTVTGANGSCSGTANVTVTVNPLPVVDAGPDTSICQQATPIQLGFSPAGGTWSGPNVNAGGQFTPATTGSFTLNYSFTDANGCSTDDSRLVTVTAPTIANAGGDFTLCADAPSVTLTGSPSGGTWTGSGVSAAGDFDPTVAGTFELVYTLGSGACLRRDTLVALVNPLPVVDAGTDFTRCIDAGDVTLNGTPAGGSWSGVGITNPTTGIFSPSTAGAGSHLLSYLVTDGGTSCSNTDDITAVVNPLPVVSAGPDTTLCNQPVPVQLGYSPAGGTWSGPNITAGGAFTATGLGNFTVTYTFTDGNGCINSDSRVVTVGAPSTAAAGPDFDLCVDAPDATLNATPAGGAWTGPGVSTAGVFDPSVPGTFELVYTFGAGSCLTRDTLEAVVFPLPIVDAGNDFSTCVDAAPTLLTGTPTGGSWSGNGMLDATGNFSAGVAGNGVHTLTYSFTDGNGCSASDELIVTINPLPVVSAGNDTTLCNQPIPVQMTGSPAGGSWSGPNITAGGLFTPSGPGTSVVTYTFSNGNSCTASDSKTINVVNAVLANAGANQAVCIDGTDVTLTGSPATGTWSGPGITPGGIFDPTAAGSFDLVFSNGGGNCLTRDTMVMIVDPLPVVNAGLDQGFCPSDSPLNFSGTPTGGTWSGTGITNAATGVFNPGILAVGSHDIVYQYTDPATGCMNRDTLVATINALPVVNFTFPPVTCVGDLNNFTFTGSGGGTFDWTFGDGTSGTGSSATHSYSAPGFYDIELFAASGSGCRDSLTQTIEVHEAPVANFNLTPDTACAPVNVTFVNNSTGPLLTYSWDFGDGTTSSAQNPPAKIYQQGVLADTTYFIVLTASNFCGTDADTNTVTANPGPNAIFGTNTNIGCSPLVLDIINNSLGMPDSYFWDFGDGSTSTSGAPTFQHTFVAGAEDTTYTIMLAIANECGADTAYHSITVLPNSVNAFFNTDAPSGCAPHTVNFTQFSTGGTIFSWDFGDGNLSGTVSPTHTFSNPGSYVVSLFVNDGCGYDTAQVTINVFPSPVVAFTSTPDSVCVNMPFNFVNQSGALASCSWDFGDGATSTLQNPDHAYSATGTYNVTLTGTSLTNGCTASVTHPAVVSLNPVAAFGMTPNAGCVPLTVGFTSMGANITFRSWSFGDGNVSAQVNPTHTFTTPGTFTVKLYVENANGCADSLEQIVTVYALPVSNFNFSLTNPCYPPVTMTTVNGSTGAVSYTWDFGDGAMGSTLTNPQHVYATGGHYTVTLVAENMYGCTHSYSATLDVYNTPIAAFTLPDDSVCVGEPVVFTSASQFADSIIWDFNNGSILGGSSVTYSFPGAGTYPVTIRVFGAGGCGDTLTLTTPITVHPKPIAGFTYFNVQNPDPLSGTVEFTNTSVFADTYLWIFGNGDSSTVLNPVERYRQYGDFNVTLYANNHFGCRDTARATVNVDFFYGLYIPNAISPGHSHFEVANFIPKGVGLKEFELLIYDDWGNLIWSTTALDEDGRPTEYWDGTFRGQEVQEDSYVWKVTATFLNEKTYEGKEYKNGVLKKSGTVTVIR